jgi:hypothetical protein
MQRKKAARAILFMAMAAQMLAPPVAARDRELSFTCQFGVLAEGYALLDLSGDGSGTARIGHYQEPEYETGIRWMSTPSSTTVLAVEPRPRWLATLEHDTGQAVFNAVDPEEPNGEYLAGMCGPDRPPWMERPVTGLSPLQALIDSRTCGQFESETGATVKFDGGEGTGIDSPHFWYVDDGEIYGCLFQNQPGLGDSARAQCFLYETDHYFETVISAVRTGTDVQRLIFGQDTFTPTCDPS